MYLKNLEKNARGKYEEYWIETRLKRAENRANLNEVEIQNIKTLKEIFDKKMGKVFDTKKEKVETEVEK